MRGVGGTRCLRVLGWKGNQHTQQGQPLGQEEEGGVWMNMLGRGLEISSYSSLRVGFEKLFFCQP